MSMGLVRVLPEKSVVGAQGEMPPDTTLSRATVYRISDTYTISALLLFQSSYSISCRENFLSTQELGVISVEITFPSLTKNRNGSVRAVNTTLDD